MFEGGNARKAEENLFVQRDRRADGGARRIRVTRSDILISRRFAGVAMVICVPVAAYRGVALDVREAADGGSSYRLSLAHHDPDLDITLAETQDAADVAAQWRSWAGWLELPRLMAKDGVLTALDATLGAVAAKEPVERRRNMSVLKRRPRFLSRRKPGDGARMNAVFADEREIISYE